MITRSHHGKILVRPNWVHFGPNMAQNLPFLSYLKILSLFLAAICAKSYGYKSECIIRFSRKTQILDFILRKMLLTNQIARFWNLNISWTAVVICPIFVAYFFTIIEMNKKSFSDQFFFEPPPKKSDFYDFSGEKRRFVWPYFWIFALFFS